MVCGLDHWFSALQLYMYTSTFLSMSMSMLPSCRTWSVAGRSVGEPPSFLRAFLSFQAW